jgi:biotin carboxylase
MLAPDLSTYRAALVCADPARTARELTAFRPVAVVAGQEPGVPLADVLSEMLELPTNGSALAAARRDKYLMIEALRKAGLRCADQFRSDDVESVVAWARERADYPVVVKPLAASGGQGVQICADAGQVRRAAAAILGTTTMYEQVNTEVLTQSFLDGAEYVVDSVSGEGKRYTCGVWRYEKHRSGTRNNYHRKTLLPADDPVVETLTRYVDDVLDALGIAYGPSHAEVMLTAAGPALVEIGARLMGAVDPAFDTECCGADQASVSALAYLRPDEFRASYAGRSYRMHRAACMYFATTELDGTLTRIDADVRAEIDALESARVVTVRVRPGDRLRPTVDLPTSPLVAHLAHESSSAFERDYRRIVELTPHLFHVDGGR